MDETQSDAQHDAQHDARSEATRNAHNALLDDPQFIELAKRKTRISGILTAAMLLAYFGFVFLLAFSPDTLSGLAGGDVTWGIPLGIGVILVAWVLTGLYVRWANGPYDAAIALAKAKLQTNIKTDTQ